ncbi:MAG: serine/threonine-protein kinase [Myxococcota bacterium]
MGRDIANPALEAKLHQTWEDLGVDVATLEFRDQTVVAPVAEDGSQELSGSNRTGAALELGGVLGEGGMGIVREAIQTGLDREVAVKSLRPEKTNPRRARQLLREGRVTGWLEHPNIVPVHDIGEDEFGQPILVMKRIEGVAWADRIEELPAAIRLSGTNLSRQIRILQQVATAVDFAHSRGILHRDIKPDNVMIGSFGEVYVVDWGIAVRFEGERPEGVPHVSDLRSVEGTPAYMAPEMAAGDGAQIGVGADVYLLGATLHHMITGLPPHVASTLQATLLRSFISLPPTYGPEVPRELGAIVRRAMSREPKDRYETAAAFADALEEFLSHRSSLDLFEEAERRTDELIKEAQSGRNEARIEGLFHEARFGFEQALRQWPSNEEAQIGRRRLLEGMIRFELDRGDARAATVLLRQHDQPLPALEAAIEGARRDEEDRTARLRALELDVDRRFGIGSRTGRIVVGAVGFSALCFVCGALTRFDVYPIDHLRFASAGLLFLAVNLVWTLVARRKLLASAMNRQTVMTSTIVFISGLVLWPMLGAAGVSMPASTAVASFVNGLLWLTLVPQLGRGWLPIPIGHAMVSLASWWVPAFHFEIFGLTVFPFILSAWLIRRDAQREARRSVEMDSSDESASRE